MANKKVSSIAKILALAMGVCAVVSPLAACNDENNPNPNGKTDPNETNPLLLASDVLDGVFNPFFYTSGSDGEVVAQTQVGMLSSDAAGQPLASWDEPSVAFEYGVVTTGTAPDESKQGEAKYDNYYTDYYFALKDNIKFSDGTALTKDDVLFNIYMYLDPAYTGSNTMYSVNIRGLAAYRAQDENATEASASTAYFNSKTDARINLIREWANPLRDYTWDDLYDDESQYEYDENQDILRSDLERVHELFKEEVKSDWTSSLAVDLEKDFPQFLGEHQEPIFKDYYEVFLYNYGYVTTRRKYRPNGEVGADGKEYYYELVNDYCGINHSDCGGKHDEDTLTNWIYDSFFGLYYNQNSPLSLEKYKENLLNVISYYATASSFRDYVRSDIMSKEFNTEDGLKVPYVNGIEVIQGSEITNKNKDGDVETIELKDADGNKKTYDILHIRINGVDPKAIQNFSFTVAPGHYYSNTWDRVNTGYGHEVANPYFGVEFTNTTFMDSVRVIHVPMGAGPYRATAGDTSRVPDKTENTAFFNSSVVFMERNEHFMLGAPKIKQLRYQVVNNNMLYNSVKTNQVHYASPSMDQETLNQLINNDSDVLRYERADNLGYGYIGVSARYVPNIWVRRAIMSALNPQLCVDYYGTGNAEILRRPMSKTLTDYYDEQAFSDYKFYHYYPYGSAVGDGSDLDAIEALPVEQRSAARKANAEERVRNLLQMGGVVDLDSNDVLIDPMTKKSLKYTFTIAGGSDDHPAYTMMQNACDILNDCGFDVSLKQDNTALAQLASGTLTVWAAAWSSSSDPDMYQVYHTESNATSTKAWGYDAISTNTMYTTEREILERLDALIEQGRETTIVSERKRIYIEAQNTLMELAVEFPTYQRKVYYVWRSGVFDESTMITGTDVGTYQSPLSRIWEVEFAK